MYVRVLGPVAAESGGESVAVSRNQRLFIALLAAGSGQIVSADALVDALWGDDPPDRPSAALQNLVSRIRARLTAADAGSIVTRPPGYGLMVDDTGVDRLAFEGQLRAARAEADGRRSVAMYDAALGLWRGTPYAEFDDVPTLHADAVRLGEIRAVAREERLERLVELDPAVAVAELESLAEEAPYRERGHALLMEALHRSGRRRDALKRYARYRDIVVEELGLDPSPAMQRLEHDILDDGLERPGAPAGTGAGPPSGRGQPRHNLPTRRTSFVGRAADIVAISGLVADDRMVSLVGAGGAGKTSLAVEVARSLEGRFADGVWLVDLLALADGGHIAQHAAATIGLPVIDHENPTASLVGHLAGSQILVVLDNCEHLVDAAAGVADALLDGGDGIRILTTSRETLRVAGETVWHVDPLDVPDESAGLSEVIGSASGRLFVDRVDAADPRFQLEERDTALIRTICRRLDGLPLAIELAASRVPSLGLQQVATRLDDRFGLLAGSRRHAIAHHQTLRAAIAWSVDLLDVPERLLLGRLSVFRGGFDLEAAEAICADERLAADRVPAALAALVERSLVVAYRRSGVVRYRLLETIREFATTDLDGDDDAVHQRHRDRYLALAKAIGDGFLTSTSSWYETLRTEFPNLRSAFAWSMDRGDAARALDLAASLRWAPFNTGDLYREHRGWIEAALAAARRTEVDDETLARGLVAAGAVAGLETRPAAAVELLTEAIALLAALGADQEIIWCRHWLGAFDVDLGEHRAGVGHTRAGLELARSIGDPAGIVYLANQHAENAMAASVVLDDPSYAGEARDAYVLAVAVADEHGVEEGLVRARHGLAVLGASADPHGSLGVCHDTLADWRRLGHGNRLIMSLVSAARIALLADAPEVATAMLVEGVDVMVRVGWRQPLGRLLETAAIGALGRSDGDTAAVLAGAASSRFLTPRWHVPLPVVERHAAARAADPASWDRHLAAGRAMGDDEAMAVVSGSDRSPQRRRTTTSER